MGYITDYLGRKISNAYISIRNKLVRGEYHVKHKAVKAAYYINAVGTNIVNDVSSGHSQMFPFQMPKEETESRRVRQIRLERERIERHDTRKHRSKQRKKRYNPYPIL